MGILLKIINELEESQCNVVVITQVVEMVVGEAR